MPVPGVLLLLLGRCVQSGLGKGGESQLSDITAIEHPKRIVHTDGDMMVAAYLPEWRYEGANWVDICQTVTHLILFSIEVTPAGALGALDRVPRNKLLKEARAAADATGTKLLICGDLRALAEFACMWPCAPLLVSLIDHALLAPTHS